VELAQELSHGIDLLLDAKSKLELKKTILENKVWIFK
jgi:hypothetical protein